MRRTILSSLVVCGMALGQVAIAPDKDKVADLEQQVARLQAELATQKEQIRVLEAQLQAQRERTARLSELYHKAVTPEETERRQRVQREAERRRQVERQALESRRAAYEATRRRIRTHATVMSNMLVHPSAYYRPYRPMYHHPYGGW